jgi:hypothetical protein
MPRRDTVRILLVGDGMSSLVVLLLTLIVWDLRYL